MTTSLRIPGLVLTDHVLTLPLDHDTPDAGSIEVFAREVAAPDGLDRPFLVFLQGGPGQEAPRPTNRPGSPPWLARALRDYRVLMLDQRGTGRSTPYGVGVRPAGVVGAVYAAGGTAGGDASAGAGDAASEAEYLTHFRADAIVRDAECFREYLGVKEWSVLGQSFGGFCTLHYLSAFPGSLREAFFTGGLPPVGLPVDDIYATTYGIVRRLNAAHHRRFPGDQELLRRAMELCDAGEVRLPGGAPISSRLLRSIGGRLGADGGSEEIHYLLERDPRSPAFGHDLAALLPFNGRAPLYAVLHESSYADGGVTNWSAQRVAPDDFVGDSTLLTAEHLFPWHFEDHPELVPYAGVAQVLAGHEWPRLFDADVLSAVDVPCAAAIYVNDAFVDVGYSQATADLLPGMRRWVTDEYHHNGLRTDGGRILDRLIGLARGSL
jgi:pimeloyl-ACP methyl ester carboxylesterase